MASSGKKRDRETGLESGPSIRCDGWVKLKHPNLENIVIN